MDRAALAGLLKTRREQLQPVDVGLSVGARRRTKGLRREEVAGLAAMSTDYYTRLEQQRGPQPSEQMLAALARALRLSTDEREYLFRVAGRNPTRAIVEGNHVTPALMRVLDRLEDSPALILSDLGEVLVQNRMAAALFGDSSTYTGWARSEIYRWFIHSNARSHYPACDHDRQSRALVAGLGVARRVGPVRVGRRRVPRNWLPSCRSRAPNSPHCGIGRRWSGGSPTTRSCFIPVWDRSKWIVRRCSPRISPRRYWCSPRRRTRKPIASWSSSPCSALNGCRSRAGKSRVVAYVRC